MKTEKYDYKAHLKKEALRSLSTFVQVNTMHSLPRKDAVAQGQVQGMAMGIAKGMES